VNKESGYIDKALYQVRLAILRGENWMVYNNSLYFIEPDSIDFFKTEDGAHEFCQSNYSDRDSFSTLYVQSVEDVIKQVPYGIALDEYLKSRTARDLQQLNKHSITNQSCVMNEQNLQYLKDNIKYLGFGEKLYPELEKNIEQRFPEFQLMLQTEYNKEKVSATLYFKKSETSEMYFFNKYNATLERSHGEKVDQTFYLNKGNGITTKEAYNLLNGRAVLKDLTNSEGQKYNGWVQLDLKNKDDNGNYKIKLFHENYGYDLERALKQFPIKELDEAGSTKMLLRSLEKGNLQSVTFETDGNTSKMFVEANPQFKAVNIYDGHMKPVQKEAMDQYRSAQESLSKNSQSQMKQETKDNGQDKEKEINESKKNSKAIKQIKRDSLLPKKRTSVKKGQSLL